MKPCADECNSKVREKRVCSLKGCEKNYTSFSSLTSRWKCTFYKYRKWQGVCMGNYKSLSKTSAVLKKIRTKSPLRTFLQEFGFSSLETYAQAWIFCAEFLWRDRLLFPWVEKQPCLPSSHRGVCLKLLILQIRADEMIEGLCRYFFSLSTIMQ